MKRFLGIFLTVALTASMLVGCGAKADEPANTDAAATEETTEATEETAEATEEAATEAKASLEGVKAGFIFLHDENSTYDLNFMNAAKAACEALGVEIGRAHV